MSDSRLTWSRALELPLLRGGDHACPYLPNRTARELFALSSDIDARLYQRMMDHGFRRSGEVFYAPHCPSCRACVPIRIPVEAFVESESQRRVRRRNREVRVETAEPSAAADRVALYSRYQAYVHGKEERSEAAYREFLATSPIPTLEMSYWVADRLIGVGIVDVCESSLSSVYFYYDPSEARRSLGVYSGLLEIDLCRKLGLPHWYLGFHVVGCAKMEYKTRFRPYELRGADGGWSRFA